MLLRDLINNMETEKVQGNIDIKIKDIQYDSRLISKGSMFIAIKGYKTDGHLYIEDALNRGAVAIVAEEEVENTSKTIIQVKNTRSAMAILANKFYNEPTKTLDLIGVTGTNGKTTITYMIKGILDYSGKKTGLIGTISNWIGNIENEAERTTPESLDLQKIFSEMIEKSLETCIMEVSSHALELHRVDECIFKTSVFTNLSPEHLDFHKNIENYRNAKIKLFYKTTLCNIINVDDFHGNIIANEIKDLKPRLLTFGIDKKADIYASNINMDIQGVEFDLHMPEGKKTVYVKTPGMFTVYNVMAAAAVCYSLGINIDEIARGLKNMKSIPGRFEVISEIKDIGIIIDYAHTPDALENILKSAKVFAKKRIITVFGCGGDRDSTKRSVMGKISGQLSDYSIITSDNPRTEDPIKIIKMVEDGMKSVTDKYEIVEDRKSAIKKAMEIARKDDIIIIAGKGHEVGQIVGTEVLPFNDKEIAIEIAKKEGLK